MPLPPEVQKKIDEAVLKALEEFRVLAKDNPEAAAAFVRWFKASKNDATYKHLGRAICEVLARELGV